MNNDNVSPTQNQALLTKSDEIVTSWRDVDLSDADVMNAIYRAIFVLPWHKLVNDWPTYPDAQQESKAVSNE